MYLYWLYGPSWERCFHRICFVGKEQAFSYFCSFTCDISRFSSQWALIIPLYFLIFWDRLNLYCLIKDKTKKESHCFKFKPFVKALNLEYFKIITENLIFVTFASLGCKQFTHKATGNFQICLSQGKFYPETIEKLLFSSCNVFLWIYSSTQSLG